MRRISKRYVCLVLILMLLLGLSVSALAKEEAYASGCTVHTWHHTKSYLQEGQGTNSSAGGCTSTYIEVRVCKDCGREEYVRTYTNDGAHYFSPYDSSCNGYTQTWRVRCKSCRYTSTEEHRCPDAPHPGRACDVLPCGIGLETE